MSPHVYFINMRSKKKALLLFVLLLFTAGLFLAAYIIFIQKDSRQETQNIETFTEKQARVAAEANLNLFESWRVPRLVEGYTFLDLEGFPSAYIFSVIDNYGRAGHMTISATTRFEPVIDVSTSPKTPIVKHRNLVKDITMGTIFSLKDIKSEYYYLGGKEYFVKLTLREGTQVFEEYYSLHGEQPVKVDLETLSTKYDYYLTIQEKNAQEAWENLLE